MVENESWIVGCPIIPPETPYQHIEVTKSNEEPTVVTISLRRSPENRLNLEMCKEIVSALRSIETDHFESGRPGAVIITSSSQKFFCTGLEFDQELDPHATSDGFFPLLATILDYPWPIIGALTGHTFGGGFLLALCFDYRIMNSERGFICVPAVDMGLHFDGIGAIIKSKLQSPVAAKVLLHGHKWTGQEAAQDGLVDEAVKQDTLEQRAQVISKEFAAKSRRGVFGLMRRELWGDALKQFKVISHVHGRRMRLSPLSKI